MEASQYHERCDDKLLITHPFVRHLQALVSSRDVSFLFRKSGLAQRGVGRSVYEDGADGDKYPMLSSARAFWEGFGRVIGTNSEARIVWANYCMLSAEALAMLVRRCSTNPQVRWMRFVVEGVVHHLTQQNGSVTSMLRELLCGLQATSIRDSTTASFDFVHELFTSPWCGQYVTAPPRARL